MPAGLQVWDRNGNVLIDTNYQLGRVTGSVNANSNSGGVSADLSTGIPFAFAICRYKDGRGFDFNSPGADLYSPNITVTANSVSWARVYTEGAGDVECTIYYGVR